MRPWYIARVEPNREFEAKRQLERNGFVVFLPTYLKKYKSRNVRLSLLFRNYIFISLDDPTIWPEVNRLPGIIGVMTHQPQYNQYLMPSAIASDAIDRLRSQALAIDEITGGASNRPQQYITAGTYVKVISGYLQGEAQTQKALVDWADHERATLILNMFNRKVAVQFYQRDLEQVE